MRHPSGWGEPPTCAEVAPKPLIDEPFAFPHGIRALNRYLVRGMHNENGFGKRAFTDFAVPVARSKLGAEDGRAGLMGASSSSATASGTKEAAQGSSGELAKLDGLGVGDL